VIKALIFDWGGVLSMNGSWRSISKKSSPKFNRSPEEIYEIVMKYWEPARVGKISSDEFWKNVANGLGVDMKTLKETVLYLDKADEDMISYVKSFQGKYKLAILSNQIEGWLGELIDDLNLNEVFDVIIISSVVKMKKPDIEIYKEVAKRLEVRPEECVFIDDYKRNLPPAEKLGMRTILFTDKNELRNKLEMIR